VIKYFYGENRDDFLFAASFRYGYFVIYVIFSVNKWNIVISTL